MSIRISGTVTLEYYSDDDRSYMDCWLGYRGLNSIPTAKVWTNVGITVIFEHDSTLEMANFPNEMHLRDMIQQRYNNRYVPVKVYPNTVDVLAMQEEFSLRSD